MKKPSPSPSTVIRVGGKASVLHSFADYFAGQTAKVQRVSIEIRETTAGPVLQISAPEQSPLDWPLADLRRVPDQAAQDVLILSRRGDGVARLLVSDEAAQGVIRARAQNLNKRPPVKNRGRLIAWSLGAVASVALIIFVLVPLIADQLAEFLPPKGEQALGDATFE